MTTTTDLTTKQTAARAIWNAMSILSDAQEAIGVGDAKQANDYINEAKRQMTRDGLKALRESMNRSDYLDAVHPC
jgi:hypothetical protein